ncbi:MAG TPA: SRPBCC domain-containing protein, partial [Bacteroidia bacterium]|nr:SRPBCC domain-containing protein [Bacteroidia bacterium]
KQWQYGSTLQTDWEAGSRIKFSTEWQGKHFEQWGVVLEVKPNELARYSLFAPGPGLEDKPENYFIMSYVLMEKNGKTMLEIIQDDNRPHAVEEEAQGEDSPILQALKRLAESN